MCDLCLPRRAVLGGLGTVAVAGLLGPIVPTPAGAQQPAIVPRSQWGPQLSPTGPIAAEPDVRFLLVHHTVNANTYAAGDVVGLLGAIYSFHTGPERGWPVPTSATGPPPWSTPTSGGSSPRPRSPRDGSPPGTPTAR